MRIEILGTECHDGLKLELLVTEALKRLGITDAEVVRISHERRIRRYIPLDAMLGLLINGQLVSEWQLPDLVTLIAWLFQPSKPATSARARPFGVPFLIIGDQALIGSAQIPAKLPGLIKRHLTACGVDYPDVPGLAGLLPTPTTEAVICPPAAPCGDTAAEARVITTLAPVSQTVESPPVVSSAVQPRPSGFTLAIGVMVNMVAALVYAGVAVAGNFRGLLPRPTPGRLELAIPLLALAGLAGRFIGLCSPLPSRWSPTWP
jgi:hypothetical protein